MQRHVARYKRKAKEHKASPLWEECMLQTYFTGKGCIDYFVVVVVKQPAEEKGEGSGQQGLIQGTEPQKAYLNEIKKDFVGVKGDIAEQASVVQGFGDLRSAQ